MNTSRRYSPEVRERAARMVLEQQTEACQRNLTQGISVFRPGGARPPTEEMVGFIDQHRDVYGIEPICTELPIASSTYYECKAREAGIESSVGSVGDSYENALAETINGLFKAEVIWPRGPWKNLDAVEYATLEWVDWFNNRRLLEPIGNIPPAEFEQAYYDQLEGQAVAA